MGQLTQSGQQAIPCHMISCSAIKAEGKDKEGGTFVVMVLVFPRSHYMCWGLAFQQVAGHLLADGKT